MEGDRERELLPGTVCGWLRFVRLPAGVRGVEGLTLARAEKSGMGENLYRFFLGISADLPSNSTISAGCDGFRDSIPGLQVLSSELRDTLSSLLRRQAGQGQRE